MSGVAIWKGLRSSELSAILLRLRDDTERWGTGTTGVACSNTEELVTEVMVLVFVTAKGVAGAVVSAAKTVEGPGVPKMFSFKSDVCGLHVSVINKYITSIYYFSSDHFSSN